MIETIDLYSASIKDFDRNLLLVFLENEGPFKKNTITKYRCIDIINSIASQNPIKFKLVSEGKSKSCPIEPFKSDELH